MSKDTRTPLGTSFILSMAKVVCTHNYRECYILLIKYIYIIVVLCIVMYELDYYKHSLMSWIIHDSVKLISSHGIILGVAILEVKRFDSIKTVCSGGD